MSIPDFIEIYPAAITAETCAAIVRQFEQSGDDRPGEVGGGIHPQLKDSRDIEISGREDWRQTENTINHAVFSALLQYTRRYPYLLIAPFMLQTADHPGAPTRRLAAEDITAMSDAQLAPLLEKLLRPGRTNLQRYTDGRGGYPYWHCEHYPRHPDAETLHRTVLWTLYLNDGFEAGETEFLYQQRRVVPRSGTLLIAPVAFTHTHRGNTPRGGDKYIATGWALFQRAEKLFG
jgi:hypothetical protein